MVQGEPTDADVVQTIEDMQFAVNDEYADIIDYFQVDYLKGFLRKGFAVYPNGYKGSC